MLKYNVTLKTTPQALYTTMVEIEDRGDPVQNNGAAIKAAIAKALSQGQTVKEPVRVEAVI